MEQSFRDANRPLLTFCVLKIGKNGFGGCVCVSGVHMWNIFAVFLLLPKNFFIHSNVIGSAFAIGKTIKFLVKSAEKCLDKCFGATSESDGLSLTSDQSQLHQNLSIVFLSRPRSCQVQPARRTAVRPLHFGGMECAEKWKSVASRLTVETVKVISSPRRVASRHLLWIFSGTKVNFLEWNK